MAEQQDKPRIAAPEAVRVEREQRLARALRDNLRRRKEQARAKAAGPTVTAHAGKDRDPDRQGG